MIYRAWMALLLLLPIASTAFAEDKAVYSRELLYFDAARSVAEANNLFMADLYARVREKDDNLFFSPYSIEAALAMSRLGARGRTAEQMSKVMRIDALAEGRIDMGFLGLDLGLNGEEGVGRGFQLSAANAVWAAIDHPPSDEYVKAVKRNFGVSVGQIDFAKDPDAARVKINEWVEEKTNRRIKDLFARGTIDSGTRMTLVSAIYFKGSWLKSFKPTDTHDGKFVTRSGHVVDTPMMRSKKYEFRYGSDDLCQAVEMDYVGDQLSMILFLPWVADPTKVDEQTMAKMELDPQLAKAGLEKLEAAWSAKYIQDVRSSLRKTELLVRMPKWKSSQTLTLTHTLLEMGMPQAFSPEADFSGMGTESRRIDGVFHKSFVEVNEEGTEAAAATGMKVHITWVVPQLIFNANRTFLYVIIDKPTGAVLFAGRMGDPTK